MTASFNRRAILASAGTGFGMLALRDLFARTDDFGARQHPHHAAKAKRCIFLFMPGGPSQIDLFDPKPTVLAQNGQPLPFEKPKLERTKTGNLFGSPWKFSKHGECGADVSELLPQTAQHVDDLCIIRSMVADNINHTGASLQMNTGEQAFSRPSLGSWVSYGLGTENQNLPSFVVSAPAPPFQGAPLWSSSFLPAQFQGTWVRDAAHPIADLKPTGELARQRTKLDFLREMNDRHKQDRLNQSTLHGRIESFELAFRMQAAAPEAFDLSRESAATQAAYGLDQKPTEVFGRQCLLARRLVERGVRFVQLYDTGTGGWDHHGDIRNSLPARCRGVDQPIAALLQDLKQRGLLQDTLVVWGGEFGRTPTAEGADGREHHPFGFTMWLAGGGIQGGMTFGTTDEFGWHAVENKVHVHDLHATILHLMGLDHERLTYRYGGRDYRLTDVHGRVVRDVLA
jgi:hypothetical protein